MPCFAPRSSPFSAVSKKRKLLGQEIELNESLKRLDRSAVSVEQEVAALPAPQAVAVTPEEKHEEAGVVRVMLAEAARSPKAALILLASELEKLAREILHRAAGRLR